MNKDLIFNHKIWITDTNPSSIHEQISNLLSASGYTVLGNIDHHFQPYGYTCVWLLAESHLAVHTFPEHNRSYIELSGCNDAMNKHFIEDVKAKFEVC